MLSAIRLFFWLIKAALFLLAVSLGVVLLVGVVVYPLTWLGPTLKLNMQPWFATVLQARASFYDPVLSGAGAFLQRTVSLQTAAAVSADVKKNAPAVVSGLPQFGILLLAAYVLFVGIREAHRNGVRNLFQLIIDTIKGFFVPFSHFLETLLVVVVVVVVSVFQTVDWKALVSTESFYVILALLGIVILVIAFRKNIVSILIGLITALLVVLLVVAVGGIFAPSLMSNFAAAPLIGPVLEISATIGQKMDKTVLMAGSLVILVILIVGAHTLQNKTDGGG